MILPWSASVAQCPRGTLSGKVTYVRDGDTIELAEMAVRLSGLAAPEWNEPGGAEARKAMIGLVRGRIVRCEFDGTQTYDRCAGICYLEGRDIAAMLVSGGSARDCPRYSGGRYRAVELQADAPLDRKNHHRETRGRDAARLRLYHEQKKGRPPRGQ